MTSRTPLSQGDLRAPGLKLRTPADDAGRSRCDDEDQDDEAAELLDRIADWSGAADGRASPAGSRAEQVAAEREKRAGA